jgi:hypothetical protein
MEQVRPGTIIGWTGPASQQGWAMRRLSVMVSCADDANRWRDIVEGVRRHLQHSYQFELNLPYAIDSWDYRIATPTVVPRGRMAGPSLAAVGRSECLIVIVDGRVGPISREEVLEAFKLQASGQNREVHVFLRAGGDQDGLQELVDEVRETYGQQILWTTFDGELDFQARIFCCLNEEMLRGTGDNQLIPADAP